MQKLNNMELFSLILGIIALLITSVSFSAYGVTAPLGIIVGIAGLAISLVKWNDSSKLRVLRWAIVLSICAISIGTIVFAIYINSVSKLLIDTLVRVLS